MEGLATIFDALPLLIVAHVKVLVLLAALLTEERRLLLHDVLDLAHILGFLVEAPRGQLRFVL